MSNGRDWDPDEKATLRRMSAAGYSDGEIGLKLDRHPKCVGRMRRDMRIEPGQPAMLRAMIARLAFRRQTAAFALDFQSSR